jgi:hypothetical protein
VEMVDPPIEAELAARQPSSPLDGAPAPEALDGEQQKLEVDQREPAPDDHAEFSSSRRAQDGWTPFVLEGGGEGGDAEGIEHGAEEESEPARQKEPDMEPERAYDDWFEQAEARGGETLDFPKRGPAMRLLDHRPEERKRMNERVSTFFPDPETTDWSIGEIAVERRRRRAEH